MGCLGGSGVPVLYIGCMVVNKQPESVYGSSYMFWRYIANLRERS
jgi:hypothetical protein